MFVPASAYLDLPREPQPWVIDKLIPVGGLVNVFGKPKTGKSFLMLGAVEALVNGASSWQGFAIKKPGPVAYLQVDTPREEWATRVARLQWSTPEAADRFWIADMWQVPEFPFNILNPHGVELQWLKDNLAAIQPVVVVIDTLREIHGGDENDSTVMRNVIANLVGACRPAAIVLVSHARKDSIMTHTGEDDLMDQQRGSSYVSGRMDVIIKVSAKRLIFKGRATGQQSYNIHQDERGFICVEHQDPFDDCYRLTVQQYPDDTDNKRAERIAHILGISQSHAYRKVRAKSGGGRLAGRRARA
jgi:RecA-family ATPase